MQQNSCLSFPPRSLRLLRVSFFCVLLSFCAGQHDLISSLQPIVARVGDDIMLPCHLEPVMDVAAKTLEWTRPDLNNILVHVWRSGQEFVKAKHPSYTGRTSLFTDELKHGNMSLKLSEVKLSDKGTYKCFIPELRTQSIVEVVVASDAAAPLVISFSGVDESSNGVVLQCESKGWYPEPEVLWLDGEGNVLSAGPTETVRGPDDLYTVSSRVTVDKRHGNRFTCRVQQNIINQTRETHIHVSDNFFKVQSISFGITVGLVVSLAVCIMLILLLVLWKKKNKKKEKEREWEQLMTDKTVQREEFDGRKKPKQVERKETELQQLHEEKQEKEKNLQTLKNKLEDKNKELETAKAQLDQLWFWSSSKGTCRRKIMEIETEVETLNNQVETMETELQTKIKEIDRKQAEVQQLQNVIKKI
ncbi:butyrophilin subfamily 3 member A2-like isoform X1 [Channa argus]|uniref:butyrophilin subfamily 3 member A2-like isoform X1 n=1 Tax=Channa argus TaxID=215402 RepID=UPI0035218113